MRAYSHAAFCQYLRLGSTVAVTVYLPGQTPARLAGRTPVWAGALGAVMASNPRLRDTLLALAERHGLKQARAEEIGWDVLLRFLKHADGVAAGRTKKPFLPDDFHSLAD
jgi:hypothetical protein